MIRSPFAFIAALILSASATAQPAPKPDDAKIITKVYDLKSIVGDRGKASRAPDVDAVIKLILDTVSNVEFKPGTDGPQLIEREGNKLEVRARAKLQHEIGDLIDALERLADLAVDVKADVIELDPAAFEKFKKLLPKAARGKPESPVLVAFGEDTEGKELTPEESKAAAEVRKIIEAARPVQSSTGRFLPGVEGTLSARQSILTYYPNQVIGKKPPAPPQFVKEGFKLVGVPVVSPDRRFVRLKLTEQSTVITGMKTRDVGEIIEGQKLVLSAPDVTDLGATGSAFAADGSTVIFKLAYAPKDKVWIVVLHPTIFIQAEEDVLKKEKEKKGKKR